MRQSRGGSGVGGGGETLAAHAISMGRCRRPCLCLCRWEDVDVDVDARAAVIGVGGGVDPPPSIPSRASYASRNRINVAGHRAEPIRTSPRPDLCATRYNTRTRYNCRWWAAVALGATVPINHHRAKQSSANHSRSPARYSNCSRFYAGVVFPSDSSDLPSLFFLFFLARFSVE